MQLSFDPHTIEHLGFKMYSHLPNAVAELVANAFDADATHVQVEVAGGAEVTVRVADDGHGMSDEDLENKYLKIGRNRLKQNEKFSESGRRRVTGKKGLGKLALFGIGEEVSVITTRVDSGSSTSLAMSWSAILSADGVYEPVTSHDPVDTSTHGTTVSISQLKRKTPIDARQLAVSLARLFDSIDSTFRVDVLGPDGAVHPVVRDLRYESLEVEAEWMVPEDFGSIRPDGAASSVRGRIIAAKKPVSAAQRGITIYVNGRLANDPEFFGVPESSYAFSYLTGHLDADYLDDLPDDVIATDRRSISWDLPESAELHTYLQALLREVSRRRRDSRRRAKKVELREKLDVDQKAWVGSIRSPKEASALDDLIDVVTSPDSDLSSEDQASLIGGLRTIAPEYADYHWRQIHPSLQEACVEQYEKAEYFSAVQEAIKRYVNDLRRISSLQARDMNLIEAALKDDGTNFDILARWSTVELEPDTRKNLRGAQKDLSTGMVKGFRNPLAHEEKKLLRDTGIFTYQDCLDALSILSHLRRRLDGQE